MWGRIATKWNNRQISSANCSTPQTLRPIATNSIAKSLRVAAQLGWCSPKTCLLNDSNPVDYRIFEEFSGRTADHRQVI